MSNYRRKVCPTPLSLSLSLFLVLFFKQSSFYFLWVLVLLWALFQLNEQFRLLPLCPLSFLSLFLSLSLTLIIISYRWRVSVLSWLPLLLSNYACWQSFKVKLRTHTHTETRHTHTNWNSAFLPFELFLYWYARSLFPFDCLSLSLFLSFGLKDSNVVQ